MERSGTTEGSPRWCWTNPRPLGARWTRQIPHKRIDEELFKLRLKKLNVCWRWTNIVFHHKPATRRT